MALMKILHCVVQIHRPTETFVGQVEPGNYTHADGIVTLVNHDGVPLRERKGKVYEKKLTPEEDPRVIGCRLTKQRYYDYGGSKSDFSRPLDYRKLVY
jgi:hypothetical protein